MSLGKSDTQKSFEKNSPPEQHDGSLERCRASSPNVCGASALIHSSSTPPVYRCKTNANAESNMHEASTPSTLDVFSSCSTIGPGTENSIRSSVASDANARPLGAPSCPERARVSGIGMQVRFSWSIASHCRAKVRHHSDLRGMVSLVGDFCSEELGKREARRIPAPPKKSRN